MAQDASTFSRRRFLGTTAAALGSVPFLAEARARNAEKKRPNILLILADDFGYECVGANGGTSYATPTLDALARNGMRFEHCYSTPLCSPSRVTLMTGRYGFRNYRGWGILDPREKTFGHMLREAGYATCVVGKWQLAHFDDPNNADQPFRAGFDEHCLWTWEYAGKKPSRYWDPMIWQNGKLRDRTPEAYGPDIFCNYLIDFITRNAAKPFFAYYCLNLAHAPYVATPDSADLTPAAKTKGNQKYYADMVAYLDKCVGRVLKTLDDRGLRENTLVLFTGDNGTPRGITSKLGAASIAGGKSTMTDAGTHVPLIANWKETIAPGRVDRSLVDFTDFVPTIMEAAGVPLPSNVTIDGRSFLPQLLGRPGNPRTWAYIHFPDESPKGTARRAVRTTRWKLHGDGRLFDMQADPLEQSPVTVGAEAQEARKALKAALDALVP